MMADGALFWACTLYRPLVFHIGASTTGRPRAGFQPPRSTLFTSPSDGSGIRASRIPLFHAEKRSVSPPPPVQVMILHPQVGHGGVWRQPCRPRLLAGRSLSSAALSWSDDDVYRLARALASWHRACFLVSSTLSGSVVDFLDRRHREQHDGIWSSRVST